MTLEGLDAERPGALLVLQGTVARGDHRPRALPGVRRGHLPAGPSPSEEGVRRRMRAMGARGGAAGVESGR